MLLNQLKIIIKEVEKKFSNNFIKDLINNCKDRYKVVINTNSN